MMVDLVIQPEAFTACVGEDVFYMRDMIEMNMKLIKNNQLLNESCENFVEVEKNLHKRIDKLQEINIELINTLDSLVDEFQSLKSKELVKGYHGYLKALKALDKYAAEVKQYA